MAERETLKSSSNDKTLQYLTNNILFVFTGFFVRVKFITSFYYTPFYFLTLCILHLRLIFPTKVYVYASNSYWRNNVNKTSYFIGNLKIVLKKALRSLSLWMEFELWTHFKLSYWSYKANESSKFYENWKLGTSFWFSFIYYLTQDLSLSLLPALIFLVVSMLMKLPQC